MFHGMRPGKKDSSKSHESVKEKFDYDGDPNSVKNLSQKEKEGMTQKIMTEFKEKFGVKDS